MEAELSARFPEDSRHLRRFTRAVKSLEGFSPPLDLMRGARNILKGVRQSLRYLLPLQKWSKRSIESFASGFKSRELRESFVRLWYPQYNMLYILLLLGWLKRRYAGYLLVNSLGFSRAMEKKLRSSGGEIRYGARVDKVILEKGRATGVRLASGEFVGCDYLVHAAACGLQLELDPPVRFEEEDPRHQQPLPGRTLGDARRGSPTGRPQQPPGRAGNRHG